MRPKRELAYLALVAANGGDRAAGDMADEDVSTEVTVVEDKTAAPEEQWPSKSDDAVEPTVDNQTEDEPAESRVAAELAVETSPKAEEPAEQQGPADTLPKGPAETLPEAPALPQRTARRSLSSSLMFGGEKVRACSTHSTLTFAFTQASKTSLNVWTMCCFSWRPPCPRQVS